MRALESILRSQPAHGLPHIRREQIDAGASRCLGKYIASQGGRKRHLVSRVERRPVSCLTAVEGLPDAPHFARDGEIPHPHFPHAFVHVATEAVKNSLAQRPYRCRLALEPLQDEHGVEHDHFQPAVDRIRDSIDLVKRAHSRLCHDRAIETRDGVGPRGAAKQAQYHWVSGGPRAVC